MDALGTALLRLARNSIQQALGRPGNNGSDSEPPQLAQAGASFVTLTQAGELRGCIGSLEAWRPLREDVAYNAIAAALHDPRFSPLTTVELVRTRIEVSLLSPPEPLPAVDEAGALASLRPGIDGLIFAAEGRRATFLPQVWEQLPVAEVFLAHLKRKAGLPAHYWSDDVRLSRYTVQQWHEPDTQG